MTDLDAREHLREWLQVERTQYADKKYNYNEGGQQFLLDALRDEGLGDTWLNFIFNYIKRAELVGIQNFLGRQYLGKAIVTLMSCLEKSIEIYGPMPEPGHPSGEINEPD